MSEPRAKSTWAQMVQAAATVCLLVLAFAGYIFTVRPVYTLARTQEELARVDREARAYREEIETNKAELDRYATVTRAFVVQQFTARLIALAEPYYSGTNLGWKTIQISEASPRSPYQPRRGVTETEYSFKGFLTLPEIKLVTGAELIETNLQGKEFELLASHAHDRLTDIIRAKVRIDSAFGHILTYQYDALSAPDLAEFKTRPVKSWAPRSLEERTEASDRRIAETARHYAAHVEFLAGLDRLRVTLLAE